MTYTEAEELALDHFGEYPDQVAILKNSILDWDWGMLFYIQSREFIETGENPIIGLSPVLVDKIDKTTHTIDYLKLLDKELEEYRRQKGHPESIKFPVNEDLDKMEPLQKVFSLMETSELSQINDAIRIVEQNELFDLKNFGLLCHAYKIGDLTEAIAVYFNSIRKNYLLYGSSFKTIPDEIKLFKDSLTSVSILRSSVEILPNAILELENLEAIMIEISPLKHMPYDLTPLKKLKMVELRITKIKESDIGKFLLPKGCKLIIETVSDFDFEEELNS